MAKKTMPIKHEIKKKEKEHEMAEKKHTEDFKSKMKK